LSQNRWDFTEADIVPILSISNTTNNNATTPKHHTNYARIVGPSVGGFVLLLIVLLALFLCRRKRKESNDGEKDQETDDASAGSPALENPFPELGSRNILELPPGCKPVEAPAVERAKIELAATEIPAELLGSLPRSRPVSNTAALYDP
jgi:hypothetical protein